MSTVDKFEELDIIELTEPFCGIPAGATGGLLELNDDDTAMVEITSIPELDIERIIFPPLSKLRRIGHVKTGPPALMELAEPFDGIPAGATGIILEFKMETVKLKITSIPGLGAVERVIFPPLSIVRPTRHAAGETSDVAA